MKSNPCIPGTLRAVTNEVMELMASLIKSCFYLASMENSNTAFFRNAFRGRHRIADYECLSRNVFNWSQNK